MASTDLAEVFSKIGLAEKTVTETLQNKKLSAVLYECIQEVCVIGFKPHADQADVANGCEKSKGTLVYDVATKLPAALQTHRKMLLTYIGDGRISNAVQLNAALDFLKRRKDAEFATKDFEAAAGVGMVCSY